MNKILLVGFGRWGKNWYNTIINYNKEMLVGIVDPIEYNNKHIPDIANIMHKDVDDVNVKYSHAIIATTAEHHVNLYSKLIKKILPQNILIEKPVGLNHIDASFLKNAFPGYIFLYHPIYKAFYNNIENIGNIIKYYSYRASMGPTLRLNGNIIHDYLIHDLYLYFNTFKQIDNIKNIKLFSSNDFNGMYKHTNSTVDLKFKSSKINVSMFSSWLYPEKIRKIVVIGTRGSIIWDGDELFIDATRFHENKLYTHKLDEFNNVGYNFMKGDKIKISEDIKISPMTNELIHFLDNNNLSHYTPSDYHMLIKYIGDI